MRNGGADVLGILGSILGFLACPGGIVVAIVGVVLLAMRRKRLGLALIIGGGSVAALYGAYILLTAFRFY